MRREGEPQGGNLEEYKFLEDLHTHLMGNPPNIINNPRSATVLGTVVGIYDSNIRQGFSLFKEEVCKEAGGDSCMVLIVRTAQPYWQRELLHLHSSGNIVQSRSDFGDLGQMFDTVTRLVSAKGIAVNPPEST